jgi:hypothetical protein
MGRPPMTMDNPAQLRPRDELLALAGVMLAEADNLNPSGGGHPAEAIRGWAKALSEAAERIRAEPENTIGAAERAVGQFIYARIEKLMDAKVGTPEGAELKYLAGIASDVEEYGATGEEDQERTPFTASASIRADGGVQADLRKAVELALDDVVEHDYGKATAHLELSARAYHALEKALDASPQPIPPEDVGGEGLGSVVPLRCTSPSLAAGDREPSSDPGYEVGSTMWHCSEEDGGPDVGINVGLGGGYSLYCGEMSKSALEDHGIDLTVFPDSWWVVLFAPGEQWIIGAVPEAYVAREALEHIAGRLLHLSSVGEATEAKPGATEPKASNPPPETPTMGAGWKDAAVRLDMCARWADSKDLKIKGAERAAFASDVRMVLAQLNAAPSPAKGDNSGHVYTYDADGRAATVDGEPCWVAPSPAPGVDREAIARIIEPNAWRCLDALVPGLTIGAASDINALDRAVDTYMEKDCRTSLAKADAILAALKNKEAGE